MARFADKYVVREWVEKKIGAKYLISNYGVWDNADFDMASLPVPCVVKATHGSGMNVIIKDKKQLNQRFRKEMRDWLGCPFGVTTCEIHYFKIQPRIVCDKYIVDKFGKLTDYKIYCFGGKPKIIGIMLDRDISAHTAIEVNLDIEWNRLPFVSGVYPTIDYDISKPNSFQEMLDVAVKLSEDFAFVRVDLYDVDGKVYFEEMTFTSFAGDYRLDNESDKQLGQMIDLDCC